MTHKSDPPLGAMRLCHRSAEWRSLYSGVLLMGLGQLLITATIPIDQGFAARLGEGSVATLGYANRIVTLFDGLGTIVAGRALLPVCPGRSPTAISLRAAGKRCNGRYSFAQGR